jgi:hypothetical protein
MEIVWHIILPQITNLKSLWIDHFSSIYCATIELIYNSHCKKKWATHLIACVFNYLEFCPLLEFWTLTSYFLFSSFGKRNIFIWVLICIYIFAFVNYTLNFLEYVLMYFKIYTYHRCWHKIGCRISNLCIIKYEG